MFRLNSHSILRFCRNAGANVTVVFGISVPVLGLFAGASMDYARFSASQMKIRAIADGAALAGAQSMRLANYTPQSVTAVVNAYVASQPATGLGPISASTVVDTTSVTVQLDQNISTVAAKFAGVTQMHVSASAKARLAGGRLPNCMISLDASAPAATSIDQATLNASGCQIYSDSSAADGLSVSGNAAIKASLVCSHGGVKNDGTASVAPAAQTDCPTLIDPLASRPQPTVGPCSFTNLKITNGSQSITPGTYCGGLQISGNANVTLLAGTYVISGGELLLKAGSTITGSDVTIFLSGTGATLNVENKSSVSLTAPASGPYSGMLIMEDRASPVGQQHTFASRNAPNMLGTIYLPQGYLSIGLKGGGGGSGTAVGATSAWTVVVARRITIADQQALTLNTNYAATSVVPPDGVGPTTAGPQLIQ